jgi:HKD family nuclease
VFQHSLLVQTPTTPGAMLDGVRSIAAIDEFDEFWASVAYASAAGVHLLSKEMGSTTKAWSRVRKRWLISIDFGHTEPEALRSLLRLRNSSVRVPNGSLVVVSRGFAPKLTCFHPKLYACRTVGDARRPLGLFVGSPNLTRSGLVSGYEAAVACRWYGRLSTSETKSLDEAHEQLSRFDLIWKAAIPAEDLLAEYSLAHQRWEPDGGSEESTEAAEVVGATQPTALDESTAVALAAARKLWVRTERLYHNRGPGHPGNQLDLPRGTRVFFGFPAYAVPRNHWFGELVIQFTGQSPSVRTMRYGHNSMDKVNLPIPGTDGPDTYDYSILLFEKRGETDSGRRTLLLSKLSDAELALELESAPAVRLQMAGGREYGLIF